MTILFMSLGQLEHILVSFTPEDTMNVGYNWLSGFIGDAYYSHTMRVLAQRSANDLDLVVSNFPVFIKTTIFTN